MEMKRYICIMPSFWRNRHWNPGDMFTADSIIRVPPNFRLLGNDERLRGQSYPIEKTPEEMEEEELRNLATEHPLPGSAPRKPTWTGGKSTKTKTEYEVLPGLKA
jgi:hypothetical protein